MGALMIKEVTCEDYDSCVELIRKGFGTVADEFGLTEENNPTNPAFIRREHLVENAECGFTMYGLFVDDRIIGFMQLVKNDDKEFTLRKVTVHPEFRHFGYGKLMLDFAKIKVREMGGSKLKIAIIEKNEVLKNWYEENGFSAIGTQQFDNLPFIVGYMESTF